MFGRSQKPTWLIVCLGNPGAKYANTRHNAGFMAADVLERKYNVKINKIKFKALTAVADIGGQAALLMKPQTYMNLSGEAVGEAARFYKIEPDHIIVISDEMSLAAGKMRIRRKGSAGGHNGLKNIIAHLGTDAFPRIKVGVGAPAHPEHEMVDWVIGNFTPAEKKVVSEAVGRAADAVECLIEKGVSEAQNKFN